MAAAVGMALKIANEYSIPVTTRGAGSSLTGGATPIQGGWVLDLSGLNNLTVDQKNQVARCGPGVVIADLQAEAAKDGLLYPPDPSSKKFCTIGGNIACNAGGLRCVKYGVTRDYVLALEGYLANGEKVRWCTAHGACCFDHLRHLRIDFRGAQKSTRRSARICFLSSGL